MTTYLPHEFGVTNCRDGITLTKPGLVYEVSVDGRYYDHAAEYEDARAIVEKARAEKRAAKV